MTTKNKQIVDLKRDLKSMGWPGLDNNKVRKENTMEALRTLLVSTITKQLNSDKPSTIYLDVLNRLLGTVNNCLISNQ